MPGVKEYIETNGNVSFCDVPFGDADNLLFCQIFYMPFERVVSESFSAEPVPFPVACTEVFASRGYQHKKLGLMIPADGSHNIQSMSVQPRFAEMKIVGVKELLSAEPAVQFGAGTFLLPDGTMVIVYRGTDDTILGWKEDLDIFARKEIPSYKLAVDYLEKAAAAFDRPIILCGHSKGGHLALYAALKTSDEIRARIRTVYNNDGPGYYDYRLFHTKEYDEILPRYRHLVPHSSFVGMMLAHDYDYTAVTSNLPLGPLQHDLKSWQIVNGELQTRADVDILAKITDVALSDIVTRVSDAQSAVVDAVANKLIEATGEVTLTGLTQHLGTAVGGAVKAWKAIEPQAKETFKSAFSGAGKILVNTVKNIKAETQPAAAKAAKMFREKVAAL